MIQKMLTPSMGEAGASVASEISYDNTISELEADNVQGAIDEINSNLVTFPDFANPTTVCSMQATSPSGGIKPFGVYTAEKTGFLYVDVFSPNNRNEWGTLKINGVSVLPGWSTGANVGFLSMYLVKQGDTIEVVEDTGNPYRFRMVIY